MGHELGARANFFGGRFGIWTAALAICLTLRGIAAAADDSHRFVGTWKTSITNNGQVWNFLTVNTGKSFKNYLVMTPGDKIVGAGDCSAIDGRWTTIASLGDSWSGTYQFITDDSVRRINSNGQTLVWTRVSHSTELPPAANDNSNPQNGNTPAGSSGPVQDVIKLTQSHMSDEVILAYIKGVTRTYSLSADDILNLQK